MKWFAISIILLAIYIPISYKLDKLFGKYSIQSTLKCILNLK